MHERQEPRWPAWAWGVAVGAGYLALALAGLWLRVGDPGVAAVWPAAGLSAAALVLSPRSRWPALVAGVVVADVLKSLVAGFGPVGATWVALGNGLEPLLLATILHGSRERAEPLVELRSIARFLLAVALAPAVSGLLGASGAVVGSGRGSWWPTYVTWVTGDAVAVLVVVPLALALRSPEGRGAEVLRARWVEAVATSLATLVTAATLFWWPPASELTTTVLLFPVGWLALRLPAVVVRAVTAAMVFLAAWASAAGSGPYAEGFGGGAADRFSLHVFALALVLTGLVVSREVTTRQRAEHAARESEVRFRRLAEAAPVGIFLTDAQGMTSYVNSRWKELAGVADAVEGLGWTRAVPPDDLPGALGAWAAAVEEGRPLEMLLRNRPDADGAVRWLAVRSSRLVDPLGRLEGFVGTVTDVTAEHEAEERARAVLERYSVAFSETTAAMWVVDLRAGSGGRLVELNDAACELVGRSRQELLGTDPTELADPEHAAAVRAGFAELASGRVREQVSELRVVRADGTLRWCRVRASVAFDSRSPRYVIGLVEDVDAEYREGRRLSQLALLDPLTGVANRTLLLDRLGHALAAARRHGSRLAVLYVDLDRFKEINDRWGHGAGDEVLRQAAARIERAIRDVDTVARIGGDEFLVVCPDLTADSEAAEIARRIQERVVQPLDLGRATVRIGASVGIALLGDGTASIAELIESADAALYQAKEQGRSRTEVFGPSLRADLVAQRSTESLVARAVDAGWLRLRLRPVVDLRTGRVWAQRAEVVIEHPDDGVVEPARWWAVAERLGLDARIGGWAVVAAAGVQGRWRGEHRPKVVVELTSRQLVSSDVLGAVEDAASGDAAVLLELPQDACDLVPAPVLARLAELPPDRVGVAVGGFGAGRSAVTCPPRLAAVALWLHPSVVARIGHAPDALPQLRSLLAFAAALEIQVVATGVDDAEQRATLSELGCWLAEGDAIGSAVLTSPA